MPKEYAKPSVLDIAVLKDDPELIKVIVQFIMTVSSVKLYL